MSDFTWNLASVIDLELARQCIQNLDNYLLKVDSIKFFGQGWDNVAFLVNEKYVFRFPRKKEAELLLCAENSVLPKLNSMVPLPIPKPVYFGKPTADYPFHFHGYEMLTGTPAYFVNLSDDELKKCLKSLAHFLKKLHGIKSTQAFAMGAQIQLYDRTQVHIVIESLQKRIVAIQQLNIFELDIKYIDQLIAQAQTMMNDRHDGPSKTENHCLVHGDLDYRHMLLQDKRLSGIIDWGDVGINHPVIDMAVIHGMFPESIHAIFFEVYGTVEQDVWSYAKFLALHRAITLMLYGYDIKDTKMFEAAKQSYERLKK